MLIKQKYIGEFRRLLSAIRIASNLGKPSLMFKRKGNYSSVLNLLAVAGFIKSFQEFKTVLIIDLRISTPAGLPHPMRNLIFVMLRDLNTLSYLELLDIQRREGSTAIYLLTTDQGLITSLDAIKRRLGGKILFKVI